MSGVMGGVNLHSLRCPNGKSGEREVIPLVQCSPAQTLKEAVLEAQFFLPAYPSCASGQAVALSATVVGDGEEGEGILPSLLSSVKYGCSQTATLSPSP